MGGRSNNFNPHSPCGERLTSRLIMSHSLEFQSTLPMRGATFLRLQSHRYRRQISIHTPHAGSDPAVVVPRGQHAHFNPHSPCGERPASAGLSFQHFQFQSTLPMRGATKFEIKVFVELPISIHTPHAGSDPTRLVIFASSFPISIHTPHAGSDGVGWF